MVRRSGGSGRGSSKGVMTVDEARRDARRELLGRAGASASASTSAAGRGSRIRAVRAGAARGNGGGRSGGGGGGRSPRGTSRATTSRRAASRSPRGTSIPRRLVGLLGALLALIAAAGTGARVLPSGLSDLPYLPIVVSLTPWFAPVALVALVLAFVGRRWFAALVAVACVATQVSWQLPFFEPSASLPADATRSVTTASPNPIDAYARVMTLNVYRGAADPASIVRLVSEQRVEVLALQETTEPFVRALENAGIGRYLPYSTVASSDGVYGNGLWSVTPLRDPAKSELNSSASFMPSGTVSFSDGKTQVRFVSVHTTSPVPGYWPLWKRSIDELGTLRSRSDRRYVLMGDFNATYDHAPFREFLGDRFSDAVRQTGHGMAFTWPADRSPLPRFAGIDHIVTDQGMVAGRVEVHAVPGADHAALLATIAVS